MRAYSHSTWMSEHETTCPAHSSIWTATSKYPCIDRYADSQIPSMWFHTYALLGKCQWHPLRPAHEILFLSLRLPLVAQQSLSVGARKWNRVLGIAEIRASACHTEELHPSDKTIILAKEIWSKLYPNKLWCMFLYARCCVRSCLYHLTIVLTCVSTSLFSKVPRWLEMLLHWMMT